MRFQHLLIAAAATTVLGAGTARAQRNQLPQPITLSPAAIVMATDTASDAAPDTASETAKHHISATELKERLDKAEKITIIDARRALKGQILKGAIHVPVANLEEWAKDVDRKTVIVTYCTCPHDEAAIREVNMLREMGFENALTLQGGMVAAQAAGIEVVTPDEE